MSKNKIITILGASGQVGRYLINKLSTKNYRIVACTRNAYKNNFLKTQANFGSLDLEQINMFDEENLRHVIKNSNIVINTIGVLYSKNKKNSFKNIHVLLPDIISKLCNEYKVEKLIHLSALGIEQSTDSDYALSKLEGEKVILNNFNKSIVIRPSIIFSRDDKFTTKFMSMLSILPIFPIYYNGLTKFQPIYCGDLCEVVSKILELDKINNIIECGGPEILNFKEILEILLKQIDKKRILIPVPYFIAKLQSKIFELFPNPLLTYDQLKLLKKDNVVSGKYPTINDLLDIKYLSTLSSELESYSYAWRQGGQFHK